MGFQDFLTITTAFVETTFFAGIFLGWPSLEYVLIREGYFGDQCSNESVINITNVSVSTSKIEIGQLLCQEARASFNLVFTLGNFLALAMSLPLGYMLDRYGTWIFRSFITILFTLGCGLLAASTPFTSGLLYPSFSLIAISGNALLVSNLHVANLVKSFRGLIWTFSNAPSAVVFFLVKKGYDADFELQHLLLILPFITIFSWIRTFLLMPKKIYPI